MPRRSSDRSRFLLAEATARLISEQGISDYSLAKRKAARQLGLADGHAMPSNEEVDLALIERQGLYEPGEHAQNLQVLRREALEVMTVFSRFEPTLTGAVASGAVSEYSLIELEVSVESSKDFEQFLVNREIEFKIQDRGAHMGYLIYAEPVDVTVRLVSPDWRHTTGGQRPRMNMQQLQRAIEISGEPRGAV